jgi:hypothetical protein
LQNKQPQWRAFICKKFGTGSLQISPAHSSSNGPRFGFHVSTGIWFPCDTFSSGGAFLHKPGNDFEATTNIDVID